MDKFNVEVLAGIYVFGVSEDRSSPVITCGFLEDDNHTLSLPSSCLTKEKHAAHIAIELFREYIAVDPRTLDIVPWGFFDPVRPSLSDEEKCSRSVSLLYKTKIHPGIPVHKTLRFFTHEELELARPRITRGHYEAYRAGVGS